MMRCLQASEWMAGRAAGLSDAHALRLEEHLGECPHCRDELRAVGALRDELDASTTPLSVKRRAHVVERALAEAAAVPARDVVRGRTPWLAGGLAAAAAVALYVAGSEPSSAPAASIARTPGSPARMEQPATAGVDANPVASDDAQAGSERIVETGDEVQPVTVGGAHLVLAAHSRVRVPQRDGAIVLERGRVEVDRQATEGAPFELRTQRFGVLVLGARFVTEPEAVQVLSGAVRIAAPDGATLVERLGAGERWTVPPLPAPARTIGRVERSAGMPTGATGEPDAQLARARALLAEQRVPEARAAIESALRARPARDIRAEALSLAAECALVEKHYEQAVAAYLQVATQFSRLGAGENALFAAGRIRAQQGDAAQARTLLHRYLARYPAGRFRDEAHRRLVQLGEPAAP
jgi:hypothetical protein